MATDVLSIRRRTVVRIRSVRGHDSNYEPAWAIYRIVMTSALKFDALLCIMMAWFLADPQSIGATAIGPVNAFKSA